MAEDLKPGDRVMYVSTEPFGIELYGATGTVLDGPKPWGTYGVLMDPQYDEHQMAAAFTRDELEPIEDDVAVAIEPGVRVMVGVPGSKTLVYIKGRGWCPEFYERSGRMYRWVPGATSPQLLGSRQAA